jgi:hypothetical protein
MELYYEWNAKLVFKFLHHLYKHAPSDMCDMITANLAYN